MFIIGNCYLGSKLLCVLPSQFGFLTPDKSELFNKLNLFSMFAKLKLFAILL